MFPTAVCDCPGKSERGSQPARRRDKGIFHSLLCREFSPLISCVLTAGYSQWRKRPARRSQRLLSLFYANLVVVHLQRCERIFSG